MSELEKVIGQAIFIRVDTPDYAEEAFPFKSLEEMVSLCTRPKPNRILEKVIVYAMEGETPVSVQLGFLSASRSRGGQLPDAVTEESD